MSYAYRSPHGSVSVSGETDTNPMPFLIGGIFLLCLLCYCCSSSCSSSLSIMQMQAQQSGGGQIWPFNMFFGGGEGFSPSIDQRDDQRDDQRQNDLSWFY